MNGFQMLGEYISEKLPELRRAMTAMRRSDTRLVLNAMTSCDIPGSAEVDASSQLYREKLIAMERAGTLYLVALPAAMKEVMAIAKKEPLCKSNT